MSLRYGDDQIAVLAVFFAVALGLAGLFAFVAVKSRRDVGFEQVRAVGYRIRKPWLLGLGATLAAALAGLAFYIPYGSGGGDATLVRVVGGQFYWSLSPDEFRRGHRACSTSRRRT